MKTYYVAEQFDKTTFVKAHKITAKDIDYAIKIAEQNRTFNDSTIIIGFKTDEKGYIQTDDIAAVFQDNGWEILYENFAFSMNSGGNVIDFETLEDARWYYCNHLTPRERENVKKENQHDLYFKEMVEKWESEEVERRTSLNYTPQN